MAKIPERKAEILARFKQILESHIDDFMAGRVDKMYELKEIADIICLHPVHLSKVIKLETGHHACYFYEHLEENIKAADISLSKEELIFLG